MGNRCRLHRRRPAPGPRNAFRSGPPRRLVGDLIRTMESDLFGAYEWAAEFYGDLAGVPEGPERLAVHRGLLRAYEALEGKADEAMRAAEGLVAAEEDLDDTERALLATLDAKRDAFFEEPVVETARAFVAAFEREWQNQQALVADAVLAALAKSNVIASLGKKQLADADVRRLHAEAAELYEKIFALLQFRVGTGSTDWRETAQSALFRAAAAWRLAGDEEKARRANEIAGPVQGAAELEGRGLR